ncbi:MULTISPECIES: hypothetical protein [unclassified Wenzhouxiangella]|uniref:hypothetical protein n=1 Tax=unclassified Wenzhouxiangella TaxID=2613841 RepID=UPI000E3275C6|nr:MULTISPECIES: hypothetical protein [unclassified Wenzhouxiangella]RFF28599.1 hypothetical protein DZK25_01995 [Wenzhouxiangella sp. 15181]RFP68126.1 hypothetical protein DZK26_09550 [Wenzhouxiangella sp. 15190]
MNTTTRTLSTREPALARIRDNVGYPHPAAATQTVDVVVIGHTGQVGSALISRLGHAGRSADLPGLSLREAINRSTHLIVAEHQQQERKRDPKALERLGTGIAADGRPTVIVDCTADPVLPHYYPEWLQAGIGVVTPNKHGFSGDLALYRSIRQAAQNSGAPLGYSATVGAGLPILSTLRRLRRAGATPTGLTAVVSGTLVHVFSQMAAGRPLSAAVDDARARGFTEPDPLEDLSGRDVARKLTIMLREAGLEDVPVEREPVVADRWAESVLPDRDVIRALERQDPVWLRRLQAARAGGETWVYLAQFGPGGACVGPARVNYGSPLARLSGSGNLARIQLADDPETPLEVLGPGAGVAVTAGAVMADLADAASELSRRTY